jgi:2',3'-cyclic-nucleotide 2'-phosphodiesterase/3'-nucleotidase
MSTIIIQTSDIHGFLYPNNYIEDKPIGVLRFENYLAKLRVDHDVILIDTGDLIQGSPLTYHLNKFQNEIDNPIISQVNHLGYDVFTLGNHEFNYGLDYLQRSLSKFNGQIVDASIDGLDKILDVKPYTIIESNDLKIGIIGLTTSHIPYWEDEKHIAGLTFNNIVETYRLYEKELKANCDFIIVNYHGGFEYDLNDLNIPTELINHENDGGLLLKSFDSIDLLLTGHQHREISQLINNTVCMQPGYQCANISQIEIVNGQIVDYKLVNLDTVVINPIKSLSDAEVKVQSFINQIIGTLDDDLLVEDLFDARVNGHDVINLIHQVQLSMTGADISAVSLFDSAIGLKKDITVKDVIALYPFPNTLKVLRITKDELIQAIEVSASYFELVDNELTVSDKFNYPKKEHYNYDMYSGCEYTIDVTKPVGQRVKLIDFNQDTIDIVVNNYRASNFAWYPMYEDKEVIKEITIDMVELLINYISENKHIVIDDNSKFKILT